MADRSVTYQFKGDFTSLRAGLAASGHATKQFASELTGLDQRGAKMRAGMSQLGDTTGKFALVATGALAAAGKAAVEWESAWAGVAKTVDGSASQMANLEAELRGLARTMPATHEEIAATAEAAGQLGVARDDIVEFSRTMLMLGETTNLTADQAATSIAQMANVMGTAPADIDNLGAALVALGNNGASTEAQILDMAQRISGAGAQIGLIESEVLAIANAVASAGIEAEAGGSAVAGAFTKMAKAAATGGPKLEGFASAAGMSATEFQRLFKDSPAEAFVAFTTGLDRINKSGGDVFTTLQNVGLSDIRVSQAMLAMAASGDMLSESLALGAESWEQGSALMEEFGKRAGTTGAEMQVAWNNVKDAGIELGGTLLPILSDAASAVTALANSFGSLPGPVKSATTGLLAITAIAGGGFWLTSKAVSSIAATREALQALGMQAATTRQALTTGLAGGAAFAAIATVGFDAMGNFDTWQRGREAAKATADTYEDLADALNASNVGKFAADLGINIERLSKDLYENGESGEYVKKVMGDLEGSLDGFGNGLKGVAGDIIPAYTSETNKAYEANSDLGEIIKNNGDILGASEKDAKAAALAQADLSGKAKALAEASTTSAAGVQVLSEALKKAREDARSAVGSFVNLAAGVDEGKFSFKEWITELERSGRAIRDFRQNAETALNKGVDEGLVADLQEMGTEGALQLEYLAKASEQEVKRVNRAVGSVGKQTEATVDQMTDSATGAGVALDKLGSKKPRPAADLKTAAFDSKMKALRSALDQATGKTATPKANLNKKRFDVDLNAVRSGLAGLDRSTATPAVHVDAGSSFATLRSLKGAMDAIRSKTVRVTTINSQADGGTVPGYSAGITVPGARQPYGDKVLAYLAPGEEVISNRYGQADRHRNLLKAINGNRLADGGTIQSLADGGSARRLPGLPFADLGPINLATSGLKALNKALRRSEKAFEKSERALERETQQRDAVRESMRSLSGDVAGKLTSDLFGEGKSNVWSSSAAGGSFEAIMATLGKDIATGTQFRQSATTLKAKGLDGNALETVLRDASPEQLAMLSGRSTADIARFEAAFNQRAAVAGGAGDASANAVFGAELKKQTRQMEKAERQRDRLENRIKEVEKAIRQEEAENRRSAKKGAASSARSKSKGRAPR